MKLKPFLLDIWLDAYEHDIELNLAASEGPPWTLQELLDLASDDERERFLAHKLVYSHPAGADGLRAAIAEMNGVSPESVQVVTGASEALLLVMWTIPEPGANVVLPSPGYAPFSAVPQSLGIETRFYGLRRETGFRMDLDEIRALADEQTKVILVNSPHHPTGSVISEETLDELHEFASSRRIQLVVNEVYHPVYHGRAMSSAARLPRATVIQDLSKAFALPGLRTGWLIERDAERRQRYWNARAHFTISNSPGSEALAEIAIRCRAIVIGKTQRAATENLGRLDAFMAEHREWLGWVRPAGGMTAFPWLLSGENSRAFCQAAAERGILLAPGDCWDAPEHFRLGFAALSDGFPKALHRLSALVRSWPDMRKHSSAGSET